MPTFQFEAMDATGAEIKDVIEAADRGRSPGDDSPDGLLRHEDHGQEEPQEGRGGTGAQEEARLRHRRRAIASDLTHVHPAAFDSAGRRPADSAQPANSGRPGQGRAGSRTRSRTRATRSKPAPRSPKRMAKSPKCFDRLYVNMIKAGEAGGALEVILQRLADFQERAESLKRKVKGAMIYPIVVVIGGRRHLDVHHDQDRAGVPQDLRRLRPRAAADDRAADQHLATGACNYWYLIPGIPITIWLTIKLIRKFKHGRIGWDQFILKMPIFGT